MSTSPTSAETTALLLESPRRLSVEEYHRMIATGILDEDERLELLEGVIVSMSPQKGRHAWPIEYLTRLLVRALGDAYGIRVQLPLTLGRRSEPEPDLAVVPAGPRTNRGHPRTVFTEPQPRSGAYRRVRTVAKRGTLLSETLPHISVPVRALFS